MKKGILFLQETEMEKIRKDAAMRIDKYLKTARLIKRRTVAKEACEQGRIHINGKPVKPGAEVKPGDKVTLAFASRSVDIEVLKVTDHVRKEEATQMYRQIDS